MKTSEAFWQFLPEGLEELFEMVRFEKTDQSYDICLPLTPNELQVMDELRELTPGQKAVVDAYLAAYASTDTYDPDLDTLVDTQTMIMEMGAMCNFDENMLCDYLAERGFRVHFMKDDALSGWILRDLD